MKFLELKDELEKFAIINGHQIIKRAKIVNDITQRTFNYSLEEPIFRKYKSLVDFNEDFAFYTLQPCIRMKDFSQITKDKSSEFHSALFHIAPVNFQIISNVKPEDTKVNDYHFISIKNLMTFLTDILKIDISRLEVVYFGGGYIDEITNGAIPIRRYFVPDIITFNAFKEFGLSEKQLKKISSLETFLLTFIEDVDFWAGYRYEVLYNLNEQKKLEIATGEAIFYKRIVKNGKIVDIVPLNSGIFPAAVGVERLLVAKNNFNNIYYCDHIYPLFNMLSELKKCDLFNVKSIFFVESLRSLHLILADGYSPNTLNKHLIKKFNLFLKYFNEGIKFFNISQKEIVELFNLNAELHPWLPELKFSIRNFLEEILKTCAKNT